MLKLGWIFFLKFKLSEMSFFKLSAPRTIFVDAIRCATKALDHAYRPATLLILLPRRLVHHKIFIAGSLSGRAEEPEGSSRGREGR
jgi:hypothetical protein